MKTCTQCAVAKELSEFYAGKSECKCCFKARVKTRYEAKREEINAYNRQYREANKERLAQYHKEWHAANRDKQLQSFAEYRQQRLGELRAYDRERNAARRKDPEIHAQRMSYYAKRRAAKLQRTTNWEPEFDMLVLREAYRLAKLRERVTGLKWHVDHIAPLLGKNVSGLHNAYNLQVIPEIVNLSKGAKFEV